MNKWINGIPPRRVFICRGLLAFQHKLWMLEKHIKRLPCPTFTFTLVIKLNFLFFSNISIELSLGVQNRDNVEIPRSIEKQDLSDEKMIWYFGDLMQLPLSFKKAWKWFLGRRMACIWLLGNPSRSIRLLLAFRVGWTFVPFTNAMTPAPDRTSRTRNVPSLHI